MKEVIINTKLSKENLVQYYKDEIKNLNLLLYNSYNKELRRNLITNITKIYSVSLLRRVYLIVYKDKY
jgi:hypothetical protein